MAANEIVVGVAPEAVFAAFACGERYADWVVGAKRIRSVDADWPAVGSRLHHTVGIGLLEVKDNTEVLAVQAPRHIVLLARFRPIGRARIELTVTEEAEGCRVRMVENLIRAPQWLSKAVDASIYARNAAALHRLRDLLEESTI